MFLAAQRYTWDYEPARGGGIIPRQSTADPGIDGVLAPHAALREAATVVTADFEFPYLAHAPMEPMDCVADVRSDSCEIWGPMQAPASAWQLALEITGLPPAAITGTSTASTTCGTSAMVPT